MPWDDLTTEQQQEFERSFVENGLPIQEGIDRYNAQNF